MFDFLSNISKALGVGAGEDESLSKALDANQGLNFQPASPLPDLGLNAKKSFLTSTQKISLPTQDRFGYEITWRPINLNKELAFGSEFLFVPNGILPPTNQGKSPSLVLGEWNACLKEEELVNVVDEKTKAYSQNVKVNQYSPEWQFFYSRQKDSPILNLIGLRQCGISQFGTEYKLIQGAILYSKKPFTIESLKQSVSGWWIIPEFPLFPIEIDHLGEDGNPDDIEYFDPVSRHLTSTNSKETIDRINGKQHQFPEILTDFEAFKSNPEVGHITHLIRNKSFITYELLQSVIQNYNSQLPLSIQGRPKPEYNLPIPNNLSIIRNGDCK
ncbi:MAG: hypothetical protein H6581_21055 [Bacteroidia bacterium]|nr:hypothetical protein [Bacteroidia bacterium]